MAEIINLVLNVQDKEADQLVAKLKEVGLEVEKVEKKQERSNKKSEDAAKKQQSSLSKTSGLLRVADQITGGWASKIVDIVDGFKGVNLQLNLTKAALISTGIGAIVVALGTIVAYWEDITNWIAGSNRELADQKRLMAEINADLERRQQLESDISRLISNQTKEEILRAKIAGASEEEITAIKRKGLQKRIAELARLSTEANRILKESQNADTEVYKKAQQDQEEIFRELGEARAALAIFDLEQQLPEEKKAGKKEKEFKALTPRDKPSLLAPGLNLEGLVEQIDFESELLRDAQKARTKSEDAEAKARGMISDREFELKQKNLFAYADAAQAVGALIGQETAAGKALAAAAALIDTYAAIAGQLRAFAPKAIPGYAIAQAIATAAVGFKAVKDILSVNVPGGGTASSPASPVAPSFNIVAGSGQNQLNQALIERDQQPVQAFITEGEIGSKEELRRKKLATSSF